MIFGAFPLSSLSAGKPILQTITKTKTYVRETQIKNAHHVSIACTRPGAGRPSPPAWSAGGAAANVFPALKHSCCASGSAGWGPNLDFLEQAGGLRTRLLKSSPGCRALLIWFPTQRWSWGCREPCPGGSAARGLQAAAARAVHHWLAPLSRFFFRALSFWETDGNMTC